MELVSIIIPVYNNERFLKESFESVINLNYKNTEIIVIDDGSTDSSIKIIKEYQEKDNRILFFQNNSNIGTAKTIKKGISKSKGRFIFFNAADDVSLEDRVERCLDIFTNNRNVGLIASTANIIDDNGLETGEMFNINNQIQNHNIAIEQFKRNYCLGATMAIVSDKDILLKEGMLEYIDDYEISLEYLLNNYDIYLTREPLVKYRIHDFNQSNNRKDLSNKTKLIIKKYKYEDIFNNLKTRGYNEKEIYITLGIFSLFVDDLNDSIVYLERSEELTKEIYNKKLEFEKNFYLGVANYRIGNYKESMHRTRLAYEIDNKNPAVLNNLSVLKFRTSNGKTKDIEMLNLALNRYPEYIDAKVNLEAMVSGVVKNTKITERILDIQLYKRNQYEV